jgi:hydroxyacylglutathione hydrolase
MLFRHLFDRSLSQSSYVIGCHVKQEAIVVDPLRDAEQYMEFVRREGMRIAAVFETHLHADFCSGARELAARCGAQHYLSGAGGHASRYTYARTDRAIELQDGDTIAIGHLLLTALHTPGHTPEHLSLLVADGSISVHPIGMLTGDFLLVHDVGRPDRRGTDAQAADAAVADARAVYRSLQRLRDLPDHLQLWPCHGAGATCAPNIGTIAQSTLGYERLVNWALQPQSETTFVSTLLRDPIEPPAYYAEMQYVNRDGPPMRGAAPPVPVRSGVDVQAWLRAGGVVVDARSAEAFAHAHLGGTLNLPGNRTFSTWFGSLINYDTDVWLLANSESHGMRLVRELACIGFDRVIALSVADDALIGMETESIARRSAASLAGALGRVGLTVLDVRSRAEWQSGHLPGAIHIPLGELAGRLHEVPLDGTIVTVCSSGARSAIAASLLRMRDEASVEHLSGGMQAWRQGGFGDVLTGTPRSVPVQSVVAVPTPVSLREIPGFLGLL